MSIAKSFTFYSQGQNSLTWTVIDAAGQPISNATVLATLFWDRDKLFPEVTPGIPCPAFNNVSLAFSNVTNVYAITIPGTFDVPPGGNYVLVVDVKDSGNNPLAHWERPAVVLPTGP